MSFDLNKYRAACDIYREESQTLDDELYQLCKRYPDHKDKSGINAKLWIIGRTYATGIERQINSEGTQGSSMEQLLKHFWNHRAEVDEVLASLQTVSESLTLENLTKILAAHGRLIRLVVEGPLRESQTPRSFVSKYLHFHNPAVPIFDSVAVRVATKCYRRDRNGSVILIPPEADKQYADFLLRFLRLYQEATGAGEKVTVKLLDNYLMALAKEGK